MDVTEYYKKRKMFTIVIMVDEEEKAKIENQAHEEIVSVSNYVRKRIGLELCYPGHQKYSKKKGKG